ncbi:MAG TPA: hypothetical protein VL742_07990 [Casimicrobiaceae bacterium]|nr:hypothetical protein [Casimicrobiaceae bacterium]
MKLSLRATMITSAIFAAICLSVAISGFTSLGTLTDPAVISDARGFAWFWTFLGGIAIAFGLLAWWMSRRQGEGE